MREISQLPKILLIADYLPEGGAGGGVILRDLLKVFPAEKLFWFAMEGAIGYKPSWRPEIQREFTGIFCPGRFRKILNQFEYGIGGRFFHCYLARKLKRIVQDFRPNLLWFVVQKRTVPFLSSIVRNFSDLPIHLSIHDDPLLENCYHPHPITKNKFRNDLNLLIDRASSIDAVSQRMLDNYVRPKQKGLVATRGIEKDKIANYFEESKAITDHLKIVMAGMGQCPSPWPNDLMEGIRLLQKKSGKKITFHAYDFTFPDDEDMFFREPIVNPEEFEQKIKTYDLGYISDPMNEYGRKFAATSFSTKLVTYVTKGLPFVYHGPEDSTTADFLKNYDCGVIVESHSPEKICEAFISLVDNFEEKRANCIKAVDKAFNISIIRKNLYDTLIKTAAYR